MWYLFEIWQLKKEASLITARHELRRCVRARTCATCGRTCACACEKTFKICVRCACVRALLGWSHTTHARPHFLRSLQSFFGIFVQNWKVWFVKFSHWFSHWFCLSTYVHILHMYFQNADLDLILFLNLKKVRVRLRCATTKELECAHVCVRT